MTNVKIEQNNQDEKKTPTLKVLDRDALRGISGGRGPGRPIFGNNNG